MKRQKRYYSREFKEKAVLLSYKRDNIKNLADELGIAVARIYKWRAINQTNSVFRGSPKPKQEEQAEIKRLTKELKDTKLELEILKKAVHIFSKSNGNTTNL